MPDLEPVGGDPFAPQLTPVNGNPFAVEDAISAINAQTQARRNTVTNLFRTTVGAPGTVTQPVVPQTPGVWSDEDEARRQATEAAAANWAPQQALNSIGGGMPMAERAGLGMAGGGIKAYHGSPYDFEKFDLGKIGTGEGAQAYGHGLYFAENPATAQNYRDVLARGPMEPTVAALVRRAGGDWNKAQTEFETAAGAGPYPPEITKILEGFKAGPPGKIYEVNINADPEHFLDWDKPLSEQHPKVQEALKDYVGQRAELRNRFPGGGEGEMTGHHVITNLAAKNRQGMTEYDYPAATDALREAGIPGIKYLDQGSRNTNGAVSLQTKYRAVHSLENSSDTGERFFAARYKENDGDLGRTISQLKADLAAHPDDKTVQKTLQFAQDPGNKFEFRPPKQQTSNYVVFNDKLIDIIKKYGLAGLVAGGASHFKTSPVDHDPFSASQ